MRLCAARDGERPGDGKSLRPCQDSSCHSPPLAVWRKPSEERYAEQRPNPCAEKGRARRVACDPRPAHAVVCKAVRSEEHTSELQSLMRNSYAVFCLKNKKTNKRKRTQLREKT